MWPERFTVACMDWFLALSLCFYDDVFFNVAFVDVMA